MTNKQILQKEVKVLNRVRAIYQLSEIDLASFVLRHGKRLRQDVLRVKYLK